MRVNKLAPMALAMSASLSWKPAGGDGHLPYAAALTARTRPLPRGTYLKPTEQEGGLLTDAGGFAASPCRRVPSAIAVGSYSTGHASIDTKSVPQPSLTRRNYELSICQRQPRHDRA